MALRTRKTSVQENLLVTTPLINDEQDWLAEIIIKIVKEEFSSSRKIMT